MGGVEQPGPAARHRYGLVLLLLVLDVLFAILAPDGAVARAVRLLLLGSVLLAVVVTSGYDVAVRRWASAVVVVVVVAVATVAAVGRDPRWLTNAVGVVLLTATMVGLVRGMARLLKERGVTVQAIAGGVAMYLLLGLLFSVVIGLLATTGHRPYFAQGTDGTASDHVYFSFTSMTTTGFGDLSPATRPGRALAVLEMLVGQIYLVTVISLLVSRARPRER